MKNLFLRALLVSLIASNSMAANLIATATGVMSAAGTWSLGGAYAFAPNYTDTNQLTATGTEQFTANFTSVAGSTTTGVVLWVYVPSVAATNIWVSLYDGSTWVAGSTVTFQISSATTVGPCSGPFFFKFGTPYLHAGATTCKFGAKSNSSTGVAFRRNATTALAYLQVTAAAQAPAATGDNLFIVGNGTDAGTINAVTVTVDTNVAVGTYAGTTSTEAIHIGAGGTLDWGTSQTVSNIITSSHNVRVFGAYPGEFGLKIGTAANPISTVAVQGLQFAVGSTAIGLYGSDGQVASYRNNYHPVAISVVGDSDYNQATQALYKTSASITSQIGWSTITFTADLGLQAGGGDTILVGATEAGAQSELMTTASYNSVAKQATFTTNFANKHSTGAWCWTMNTNAVVRSNNTTNVGFLYINGSETVAVARPHVELENVEMRGMSSCFALATNSSSYMRYIRMRQNNSTTLTAYYMGLGTIYNSIYHGSVNLTMNTSSTKWDHMDVVFTATSKQMTMTGGNFSWTDGVMDSGYIYLFTAGASGCKFTRVQQYGGSAWIYHNNNTYENYFYDCEEGRPVANTYGVGWNSSLSCISTLINPVFNSATPVKTDHIDDDLTGTELRIQNSDMVAGQGILYKTEGTIETSGAGMTDSTTRTVGRLAIKMSPGSAVTASAENLYYKIMKAVPANQGVTVYCYMQRNASYGQVLAEQPQITLESSDGAISETAAMSTTTAASTWERVSVGGQMGTTEGGFITITVKTPTTTSGAVAYVADMSAVIGPPSEGWANLYGCSEIWREGRPSCDFSGGNSIESDYFKDLIAQSTAAAVSGAVGSVTGNVGGSVASVTGNVLGNVVGSVDSVTDAVTVTEAQITEIGTTTAKNNWDELMSSHLTTGTYGQRLNAVYSGQALSGAATSLTLDSGASATTQIYRNCVIFLTGGTGAGQSRFITDYQGTTRLVTVPTWATTPNSTTQYVIIPMGDVSSGVWDALVNTYNNSGSFGNYAGLGGVRVNTVGTAAVWSDTTAQTKIMLGVNSSTMTVAIGTTTNAAMNYAYTASTRPSVAASDIQAGCTAALTVQGYTTTRAGYLDNINNSELQTLTTTTIATAVPAVSTAAVQSACQAAISASTPTLAGALLNAPTEQYKTQGTFGWLWGWIRSYLTTIKGR